MTFRSKISINADAHKDWPFAQFLEFVTLMQEQAAFGFTVSVVTPGYAEPNAVEGSIVEPVTDPTRLLEAKEVSE